MSETVEKFITDIDLECFLKKLGEDGLISRNKDYDDIPGDENVILVKKVIGKVELASTDDTKEFTYASGKISYSVSMMGTTTQMELSRAQ